MNLKERFLQAPDSQLCASVKPSIEQWDDEPTALQILKTLDNVVFAGSQFVVIALDLAMRSAIEDEGITYEQLITRAEWRHSYQGSNQYYNQKEQ